MKYAHASFCSHQKLHKELGHRDPQVARRRQKQNKSETEQNNKTIRTDQPKKSLPETTRKRNKDTATRRDWGHTRDMHTNNRPWRLTPLKGVCISARTYEDVVVEKDPVYSSRMKTYRSLRKLAKDLHIKHKMTN